MLGILEEFAHHSLLRNPPGAGTLVTPLLIGATIEPLLGVLARLPEIGLVPSIAHGMAIEPAKQGAIQDAVTQFWNDDKQSVADAQKRIAQAAGVK